MLREEAFKHYRLADHIFYHTYALIQDTKLLLGVTENLFLALSCGLSAILYHERLFKLVPPFSENFESKLQTLQQKRERYGLEQGYFELIRELREEVALHKSSPVEFRRKDRFIICTDSYKMKAITANQLREYLKKGQQFLERMNQITSRYQNIFPNQKEE